MIGLVVLAVLLLAAAVAGVIVVHLKREPGRKVRRRELASALTAINEIDDIVDRNYPQLDLVGQAMVNDIRTLINKHRKETISR